MRGRGAGLPCRAFLRSRCTTVRVSRRSDAGLRATISMNAAFGMTLTDMRGRLVRCNPAFARMLGYAEDELAGRLFSELTHPEDVELNEREYRALAERTLAAMRTE